MPVADENGLEFLNPKLSIVEEETNVDLYFKPANKFTYVLLSTCYPYENIQNVPKVLL